MQQSSLSQNDRPGIHNIRKQKIIEALTGDGGRTLVRVNIEYPQGDLADVPKRKESETFNGFYAAVAAEYFGFCKTDRIKQASAALARDTDRKPFGEIMKYFVTFDSVRYLSIVTEITHFDGYFSQTARLSHVWDAESQLVLPISYFCDKFGLRASDIRKQVGDAVTLSVERGNTDFPFSEKRLRRFAYRVDPSHYFLTPRGLAFWFGRGTLTDEAFGFPTFVLPCDMASLGGSE